MPTYRIRKWNENFEINRTRELKSMHWVPMPNKHDGDGYTELMEHENGAAHYGVWCVLVQIASRCKERGTLVRESGIPHDAATLSRQSRIPVRWIAEAMDRLLQIGWLERVVEIPQEGAGIPQEGAPTPALYREQNRENITGENITVHALAAKQPPLGAEPEVPLLEPAVTDNLNSKPEDLLAKPDNLPATVKSKSSPLSVPIPAGLDTPEFRKTWSDWLEHLRQKKKTPTSLALTRQLAKCESIGLAAAIAMIERSIGNNWQGLFPEDKPPGKSFTPAPTAEIKDKYAGLGRQF